MGHIGPDVAVFIWLSIGSVALFSFLAIAAWVACRQKEKQAYYDHETINKISESSDGAAIVMEYLREKEKIAKQKRREGRRLGGLITIAVGLGLMIFLFAEDPHDTSFLMGLIPIFIGAAILGYSYWLAPKE